MFRKVRRLHFVGIGGSGMSGIAEVLVNMGYPVSGSDLASNPATRRLKRLGAQVHRGHAEEHVVDAEVVVISSAVGEDNPEVAEARRRSIPVIPRAEMLAELMRMKHAVAVAGAHGKTSTTGMIADVLGQADLDPTVVIGGRLATIRSGARLGSGDVLVAEADESDGSFLKMKPTIAVVTNIDREHLDHYRDLAEIRDAFATFLERVPFYGAAVVCVDDTEVEAIAGGLDRKVIGYGFSGGADLRADAVEFSGFNSHFDVIFGGERLGRISLPLPGRHSVLNALAAIAVGLELDVPFERAAEALARFRSPDRRFQRRGEFRGATVIDDYGHHPTEIEATLGAVREGFEARTVVVFQPHRYSRSRALLEEFGRAFFLADHVIVTEIYAAGERPIEGIDGRAVADALTRHGHPSVRFEAEGGKIVDLLEAEAQEGDIVLTFGAGDVWRLGEALVKRGRAGKAAGRNPR